MPIRYLSYDIREGNEYEALYKVIEKHKGTLVTESLYRFDGAGELDQFVADVARAVADDDSVYVIYQAKGDGLCHRKVTP
jgi:hypothetical protein